MMNLQKITASQPQFCRLMLAFCSITALAGSPVYAFQISRIPSPTKTLVTVQHLKLVGGFRVPKAPIENKSTRFLSGSFDRLNGKWIAHHGTSGYIVEYFEPGEMGTGDPLQWPEFTVGRSARPFVSVNKISAEGVLWLNTNRVLCSGRKHYRSAFDPNWVCEFNLKTGDETLIPQADPNANDTGNFSIMMSYGMGFCRIPKYFARRHTGGRMIGMGRGGYDVLGSPQGPALAAWSSSDPFPSHVLLNYPQQVGYCLRDPDYKWPSPEHHPAIFRDPGGATGYWQAETCSTLAWIDHPDFKGVLTVADRVNGTLDYRAQGDTGGNAGSFGVNDPPLFYSADSSGDRGGHREDTQFQSETPATYQRILYVYDPDDFAAAADGIRNPWDTQGTTYTFPVDGISVDNSPVRRSKVQGLFWDSDRQLLWACITNVWGSNKFAVMAAYQLQDPSTNNLLIASGSISTLSDSQNTTSSQDSTNPAPSGGTSPPSSARTITPQSSDITTDPTSSDNTAASTAGGAATAGSSDPSASAPLLNADLLRQHFKGKWGIPAQTDRAVRFRSMSGSRGIHCIADVGNLVMSTNDRDLYGLGAFRRPAKLSTSGSLSDIPAGHFINWRTVPRTGNEPRDGGTDLNGLLAEQGVLHWTMKAGDPENENDYPTQGFRASDGTHGLFRGAHAHHNHVGGYLAGCPADLAGDYLCGFCGPPGLSTASGGPALYMVTVDPGAAPWDSLPSATLLEYGNTEETQLSLFSGTTQISGCAWIETDTARGVVFSVSTGVGEQWYGEAFHVSEDGLPVMDPYGGERGYHSNLYEQQLWVYDPEDLRKVFRQELSAGQPRPAAIIPLSEYEAVDRRNQPVALSYSNGRLTVTLANGYRTPFQDGSGQPLVLEFGL